MYPSAKKLTFLTGFVGLLSTPLENPRASAALSLQGNVRYIVFHLRIRKIYEFGETEGVEPMKGCVEF